MGLSIHAYSQIKKVKDGDPDNEAVWEEVGDDQVIVFENPDFATHSHGLDDNGIYEYKKKDWAEMGYSSYDSLREAISQAVYGIPADRVWDDIKKYTDQNGVSWLVCFAAPMGAFGPRICEAVNEGLTKIELKTDDEMINIDFENVKRLFALAANGGMVTFG